MIIGLNLTTQSKVKFSQRLLKRPQKTHLTGFSQDDKLSLILNAKTKIAGLRAEYARLPFKQIDFISWCTREKHCNIWGLYDRLTLQ